MTGDGLLQRGNIFRQLGHLAITQLAGDRSHHAVHIILAFTRLEMMQCLLEGI